MNATQQIHIRATPAKRWDAIVVGAGPAGSSFAAHAAAGGAKVLILEKAVSGRDKSCGDGLTPRAVMELNNLGVDLSHMHRVDGLRIVKGERTREVLWPKRAGFTGVGGTLRRNVLDAEVLTVATSRGAVLRERIAVTSVVTGETGACGVLLDDGSTIRAPFVAIASGAGSALAASVGAGRSRDKLQGIAIRAYAISGLSADRYLEASIGIARRGALPGYGWVFPMGDGSVNIGYGTLTLGDLGKINLREELNNYHSAVRARWDLGEIEQDWAWRLPMNVEKRHGRGWVALGDAAGLVNPCNGEGIDYALESGRIAGEELLRGGSSQSAATRYDVRVHDEIDWFLHAARRFAQTIRDPRLLDFMLGVAMSTDVTMRLTAAVLGNVLDPTGRGALERTVRATDKVLRTFGA